MILFNSKISRDSKLYQLLESLGALSEAEAQQSSTRVGSYQESVTAPLQPLDDEDLGFGDEHLESSTETLDVLSNLSAVGKVS